jgi:hypothetical protein
MKMLETIIESPDGIVLGATTTGGDVILAPNEQFPREELASRAQELSTRFQIHIPEDLTAVLGNLIC